MKTNRFGIEFKFRVGKKLIIYEPSDAVIDIISNIIRKEIERKVGKKGLKMVKKAFIVASKLNR